MTNPLFQHLAGHYTLNPAPKTIILDPARAARRSVGSNRLAIAASKDLVRVDTVPARDRSLRPRARSGLLRRAPALVSLRSSAVGGSLSLFDLLLFGSRYCKYRALLSYFPN
jgi:hypothetical protein